MSKQRSSSTSSSFSSDFSLSPQEMLMPVGLKKKNLYIGVPKELSFQENRVALTPESASLLINRGHRVVVETNAGLAADFTDRDYSEVGCEIAYDVEQVFKAHMILKVAPPTETEVELLKPEQVVMSPLHLPTINSDHLSALMRKRITAVAYEYIQDHGGSYPMVRTLSEMAGSASILIASELLSNSKGGQGVLLGGVSGVPPAKVVILGAGVVGEFATRTAMGLGAEVRVFDNSTYKLMRLQNNVNVRVYTSVINPSTLAAELAQCDVAVGGIHSGSGRTPCVVTEEMVSQMKDGSVIVDVSIDQGGCFETSRVTDHKQPTFVKHGVIHFCVPNIASRFAKTASTALSHVIAPILLDIHEHGGLEKYLRVSEGTRNGIYLYKGRLTNRHLSQRFNIKYTDLNLLMASVF